jgi:hypothetical protein
MKLSIKPAAPLLAGAFFVSATFGLAAPASADPFNFSTGNTDAKMASASRPQSAGKFEIESADDFVTTAPQTSITSATFTGLITGSSPILSIGAVTVEIYRVFPLDSDTTRTPNVPSRVNSPSDVQLLDRSTTSGNLTFSVADLGSFTALNSVRPGGIHVGTGGDGAVTGEEVVFNVNFTTPISLGADHYFFVPQVEITTASGDFLWLSAPRPIVPSQFPPGFTDLQSWTRDQFLDPDWLRIGQDIVGGNPFPTFNAAFSLTGTMTTPLPGALPLFATGLGALGLLGWRRKKKAQTGAA